eukprot:Hpha_TRINITY_DN15187_c5_g1::TRINITY_DN15187_c5_g1_i2::g.129444::m.129444
MLASTPSSTQMYMNARGFDATSPRVVSEPHIAMQTVARVVKQANGPHGLWPLHPLAPIQCPREGDIVMLRTADTSLWALRPGEVGRVVEDDLSQGSPLLIEGPRGDRDWFSREDVLPVADRGLCEAARVAAEQLYRHIKPQAPRFAASVVGVLVDALDSESLFRLLSTPAALGARVKEAIALMERVASNALPKAQPIPANSLSSRPGCALPAAIPLGVAPQPLDPAAVCGGLVSPPVATPMTHVFQASSCTTSMPSRTPMQAPRPSPSVGSADSRPTAVCPPSTSTSASRSSTNSTPREHTRTSEDRGSGSSVPHATPLLLGDALHLRVSSMTTPSLAAKVTGMLLASAEEESTLKVLLAPERSGELRAFVAEAITVLRKAGKLPPSDFEVHEEGRWACCSRAVPSSTS